MDILVLGFGRVGRRITELLQRERKWQVGVITGKKIIPDTQLGISFFHLENGWEKGCLVRLPSVPKAALVINALPPQCGIPAMEFAIGRNAHYIDMSACEPYDDKFERFPYGYQKAFHHEFMKRHRSALLSIGCDPGITNLIVGQEVAGADLGPLDIHIFDVDVALARLGRIDMNEDAKHADCAQNAVIFEDGIFEEIQESAFLDFALFGGDSVRLRLMYHDELAALPFTLRKRLRFLAFWGTDVQPRSGYRAGQISMETNTAYDRALHVGVLVATSKSGVSLPLSYSFVAFGESVTNDGDILGAVGESAAVPAVVAADLLLEGGSVLPGVWLPDEVDGATFLQRCSDRHIEVVRVEPSAIVWEFPSRIPCQCIPITGSLDAVPQDWLKRQANHSFA